MIKMFSLLQDFRRGTHTSVTLLLTPLGISLKQYDRNIEKQHYRDFVLKSPEGPILQNLHRPHKNV